MVMFDGVLGLAMLGLWIFCIIDAITTPPDKVRNLPKVVWVLIVILLVVPGSIVWLFAGRPWPSQQGGGQQRGGRRQGADQPTGSSQPTRPSWSQPMQPFGSRPGRPTKRSVPTNPDDDEEFLASLKARAEEQRRRARDAQSGDDNTPGQPT